MSGLADVTMRLIDTDWFKERGVYCIVDGQFGSTGKGVAASLLEYVSTTRLGSMSSFTGETNAGPNSGHTAVFSGHKMVTRQIPISVAQNNWRHWEEMRNSRAGGMAYLNGGAIIDLEILIQEVKAFKLEEKVFVHPNAALISEEDKVRESEGGPGKIASTGKGVGAALARKVMRENECAESARGRLAAFGIGVGLPPWASVPTILEVAQGFSLGLNHQFYPHCTSRECTVMQALADACIHPYHLKKTLMVMRTFPIRVGNTDKGHSGGMYEDQRETTWEELGQEPELTTVTKRIRRVFTWSWMQFEAAVISNRPDALFINFCNYLPEGHLESFIRTIVSRYRVFMGREPDAVILGWGPETEQVTLWK